ncbi:MAG TPA: hypothetical protein VKA30_04885 [Actinomycetota bacterium]|nr:hypothetical protein [Actinomycetota bacterium]
MLGPVLALGKVVNEIGLVLGVLGGLVVALGAYWILRGGASRRSDRSVGRAFERSATLIGFLLIGVSLGIQLIVAVGRSLK